ncbi:ABC transporter permease [Bacillus cereus]|uniref:ABC transporter permease n=1 Tax=Bacillus cereus TaxID=1396 RepID=UPI000C28A4CD|nr:ABC transporter permease [Bacillus cereus]
MTFRQFAIYNVLRNKRIYIGHFLSCVCAVLTFFIHCTLAYHPYFSFETFAEQGINGTSNADIKSFFQLAKILIIVFSFLYILYSLNVFYNYRKREFDILMACGMSRFQLKRLILIENLLIGFCAILTGIGIGLIFMKIILLISESLFLLDGEMEFYFPIQAIKETNFIFLILFIVVSLFVIRKAQPVGVLKSREGQKLEVKPSIWLSLLAIILISVSYIGAFYLEFIIQHGNAFLLITCHFIIGVLGTYLLFAQLGFYIIATLKQRKKLFYRKTNLLTISELSYRLKDNVRAICLMSILMAIVFTTIGIVSASSSLTKIHHVPYAFSYKSYKGNDNESAHIAQIKKDLEEAEFVYTIISPIRIQKQIGKSYYSYTILSSERMQNDIEVIKLSDYNKISKVLGYHIAILKNLEDSIIIPSKKIFQADSKAVLQKKFKSIELKTDRNHINLVGKTLLLGHALSPLDGSVVVVSDSVYNKIKESRTIPTDLTPITEYKFYIQNWVETGEVSKKLTKIIPMNELRYLDTKPVNSYAFDSRIYTKLLAARGIAVQFIISVLVGGVFFAFTMGFLYFRLFVNFEEDKKQYQILLKLGLTQKELKRIIKKQIGILYIMPLIVAIIHSSVALLALRYLFSSYFFVQLPIMRSSIIMFGCVFCLQIFYFIITRRSYYRHVFHNEHY